jgi:hypothetical protein
VRTSKDLIWSWNLWDFPKALVMSAAVSSTVILRIVRSKNAGTGIPALPLKLS